MNRARDLGMALLFLSFLALTACMHAPRPRSDPGALFLPWNTGNAARWKLLCEPGDPDGASFRATYRLARAKTGDAEAIPVHAAADGVVTAIDEVPTSRSGETTFRLSIEHRATFNIESHDPAYPPQQVPVIYTAYQGLLPPFANDAPAKNMRGFARSGDQLAVYEGYYTKLRVGDAVQRGQIVGYVWVWSDTTGASFEFWIGTQSDPDFGRSAAYADVFQSGTRFLSDIEKVDRVFTRVDHLADKPMDAPCVSLCDDPDAQNPVAFLLYSGCYCTPEKLSIAHEHNPFISVRVPKGYRLVVYDQPYFQGRHLTLMAGVTQLQGTYRRPQSAVMISEQEPQDIIPWCPDCKDMVDMRAGQE